MYSTCLFCNAPFEKNESLEAFPVGRRLAFDEAKGRLWVVCKKCERWSLSPLDERWEAIEQAERLFRDSRKRVSTDNIGLAKVAEGTTLIRIGAPQRPEFAAWRYGDQFGRRRRRQFTITGGILAGAGGFLVAGAAAGIAITSFLGLATSVAQSAINGQPDSIVARLRDSRGRLMKVRRKHLGTTTLSRTDDGDIAVRLELTRGPWDVFSPRAELRREEFTGAEARRVVAKLLPALNRYGGNSRDVAEAVRKIEGAGSAKQFFDRVTQGLELRSGKMSWWTGKPAAGESGLLRVLPADRLALEMALHEDAERRALEGELAELERAWRDAEEIAAIADNLTLPDSVNTALDKLKKR